MLKRLSRGAQSDRGFTLIELLLVILIIAILAAIAIPSFLNQRAKGYDAASKTNLNTAATAMQAYSTEHNGAFPASVDTHNGSSDPLVAVEPSLNNAPYVTGSSTANGYTLTSTAAGPQSAGGDVYTLTDSNGVITRACSGPNTGCPSSSW
jgi:type IV pilus assembly protein PilA